MTDNPLAPISRLKKRLNDEAAEAGLDLTICTVDANYNPDGPHALKAVFYLTPEWDPNKPEEDPEFEAFRKAQEKYEREERAKEARAQLEGLEQDLRNPNKGLGLDD